MGTNGWEGYLQIIYVDIFTNSTMYRLFVHYIYIYILYIYIYGLAYIRLDGGKEMYSTNLGLVVFSVTGTGTYRHRDYSKLFCLCKYIEVGLNLPQA